MSLDRVFVRFIATVAMGALVYSQATACCWNMQRSEAASAVPEKSEMSADHSCCKKSAVPLDGVVWSVPGMDCGAKAFESVALSHSWADFLLIPYSLEKFSAPDRSGHMIARLEDGVFDTGPPRFLEFRRLLI